MIGSRSGIVARIAAPLRVCVFMISNSAGVRRPGFSRTASLIPIFHDIGKIGINDAVLLKPGRLTPAEFEIMKTHTLKGAAILATIPDLEPIIPIVRSHHEHWDGKGYPDGLSGEAIHQLPRIVAVADAFDAMTSNRPYRQGMAPDVAFAELQKQSGQ